MTIVPCTAVTNIDTIVVGGRGQYLAEDFLLGSTSYKLAQFAKMCSSYHSISKSSKQVRIGLIKYV